MSRRMVPFSLCFSSLTSPVPRSFHSGRSFSEANRKSLARLRGKQRGEALSGRRRDKAARLHLRPCQKSLLLQNCRSGHHQKSEEAQRTPRLTEKLHCSEGPLQCRLRRPSPCGGSLAPRMRAGDEEPFLCWEDRLQASTRATGSGPRPGLPAHSSPALCLAKDPSSASPFPSETALRATCNHQGSSGPTRRPLPLAQPPWGGGEAQTALPPQALGTGAQPPSLREGSQCW